MDIHAESRHMTDCKSYREAFLWASSLLRQAGTKQPDFEAELLLRKMAGFERHQLFLNWDECIPDSVFRKFVQSVQMRMEHQPIQYILQEQEFFGRKFHVDQRVLIPRPETELLVEQALVRLKQVITEISANKQERVLGDTPVSILDIGTGSGAIAITIALELLSFAKQPIVIDAVDISADALDVAVGNYRRLLAAERVADEAVANLVMRWNEADVWPEKRDVFAGYDMILSNPPYIDFQEAPAIDREVKEYEPMQALFAEENGLAVYRRIISEVKQYLRPGGWLGLEIGYQQSAAIQNMLSDQAATDIKVYLDIAGHQRTIFARW